MTDPNFVKIGEEYFPSEWFDLERLEKMADDYMNQRNIDWYENLEVPPEAADREPVDTTTCPFCGGVDLRRRQERSPLGRVQIEYFCKSCERIFKD